MAVELNIDEESWVDVRDLYHTVSYINVVSKRNKIPLINQEYYG